MQRKVRMLSFLMAAVFVIGLLLSGCGGGKTNDKAKDGTTANPGSSQGNTTPDISKEKELVMWLCAEGSPEEQLVYDEINKLLKRDINATVKVNHFTWSDWTTKYNLLISSAEVFDIIFAATWTDFANYARRGAFYEITDEMLQTYAPQTAQYPKDVLVSGMVDGKLYGLPAYKKEFNTAVYMVRGDFMKKYNIPDIKTFDDFGAYLDAVAKNETGIIPFNISGDETWLLSTVFHHVNEWSTIGEAATVSKADPERKVFYALEKPEFVQWSKQMREWALKGYWSKNALSNRTPVKDSFRAGTSASAIMNFTNANDLYLELSKTHPEWDVRVYNALNEKSTSIGSYMVNGMAISANSENPERSLMLLDLFKNNEEYYMLTNFGIKDVHYKITDEGKVDVIASEKYNLTSSAPWGWNNGKLDKVNARSLPNYAEILKYYEDNYVEDPLREFKLDVSNVSEIDATIRDLNKQYGAARTLGMIEDVDQSIADSIKKAKDAGLDKYLAEIQKQITDYLAQYREMVK